MIEEEHEEQEDNKLTCYQLLHKHLILSHNILFSITNLAIKIMHKIFYIYIEIKLLFLI